MLQDGAVSEAEFADEVNMMTLEQHSHEHIVAILGHGALGKNNAYFVDMEYCDLTLNEYIRGTRTSIHGLQDYAISIQSAQGSFFICSILQQILSGLVFIHSNGKVHRNLTSQSSTKTLLCV